MYNYDFDEVGKEVGKSILNLCDRYGKRNVILVNILFITGVTSFVMGKTIYNYY